MTLSFIYCLKCRNFTPNEDLHIKTITTKNRERMMQKAKCTIRGKKKNRYVKMKDNININDDKN